MSREPESRRVLQPGGIAAQVGALAVAAVLAASAATAGASRPFSVSSSHGTPNYALLQAKINAAKKQYHFVAPGPPLNASKARGKFIFNDPAYSNIPIVVISAKTEGRLAKQLGIKWRNWTNPGSPTVRIAGIRTAIAQHANLLQLSYGGDPRLLQPQIAAAHRAGMKVMTTHIYDRSYLYQAAQDHVDADVPEPYNDSARLDADYAILHAKGKPINALILGSLDSRADLPMIAAMKKEFKIQCGSGCKTSVLNVPIPDWATKVRPAVQSAILADPSINYVISVFDTMVLYAAPAIQAAGASDRVKIITNNGSTFVLDMIRTGNIVIADVATNWVWGGWEDMDQALRLLLGLRPSTHQHSFRLFDKSNVARAGIPARWGQNAGTPTEFYKLWGVKR
jgi:ribose transport system substrate-binding protein